MRLIVIAVAAAGCAAAGKADEIGGRTDGGNNIHFLDSDNTEPRPDAAPQVDAAPLPDAPPGMQTMTLTQTTSQTMTANNSIACPAASPAVGTLANVYYRVFDLGALGITTDFTVSQVTFQVEDCESANDNGAPVAVHVGTYGGTIGTTLQKSQITILQSNNSVQVPEVDETPSGSPGATVNAPIAATIPGGMKMVVEVDAPDGTNNYQFYIGSNTQGQSGLGYVSSPKCSPPGTTPTDIGSLPSPAVPIDILLTVTGTY